MEKRVVVTGMGAITPIGHSVSEMWQSIKDGVCGVDEIQAFDTSEYKVKLACEVKGLDFEQYFTKRELKFNDRFTQFARIASKQAIQDASLTKENTDFNRVGVVIGSGIGGIDTIEKAEQNLSERGPSRVSPYFIPMSLINLAAGQVAIDHGIKGICYAPVTACAAGSYAIGDAFHLIREGKMDAVVCGGSEASITPLAIAGFQSMKALHIGSDKMRASIPFDKQRSGFVMGEGAGILVLEEMEHALKRGATIYGEIVGYGRSCDAYHITSPLLDGSGAALAMEEALHDASLNPKDIDYINAHGTSTPLNDKTESKAILHVFKEEKADVLVSSTKSNMGHLLGASGAVEAIICVQALRDQLVPPTINHQEDDEECGVCVVKNSPLKKSLHYVMSNSLGFGGHNASLIFKKWSETNDL